MSSRARVLFLCTGNSWRSQMAEGWAKQRWADRIEACSAGTQPQSLNPLAVRAMREVGIDISGQRSKPVDACRPDSLDLVVTVCGGAWESCPLFPGDTRVVHRGFEDPPELARDACSEEEAMEHYRRVRDEIRDFIQELPSLLARREDKPEERTR